MKFSKTVAIFLAVSITGAFAKPAGIILGYQDNLGQYSFGYSAPYQARSEVRSLDGITRGSYSYVDGAGLIQSTDYTADGQNGFRVAATNLPQAPLPVQETPEVAAARTAHLLAAEEAASRGIVRQTDQREKSSDTVEILAKSADPGEMKPENKEEAGPPSAGQEEPIIEAAEEPEEEQTAGEIQTPEALAEAAEEAEAEEKKKEAEIEKKEKENGRGIEESASVAPVIASPAASLPVPLIPVNFDLPTISAYPSRPAGAKADQTLPQSTNAQGVITPAGTILKTLPTPQLVPIAPRIGVGEEPAAALANIPTSTSVSARDFTQYERARAVFAPIAPVNVIPLGYEPTISSFLRYAPFPYITYNIL